MRFQFPLNLKSSLSISSLIGLSSLLIASPALAHHPFGSEVPANAVEGFLSGLGHPVIGLDHLAFVVASGLLAAVFQQGLRIPIAFVAASVAGTFIHLMNVDLPVAEFVISLSVLLFGVFLAMKKPPQALIVTAVAALAGVFHGYAYGEAVVGVEMTPLLSYLLGFTAIQIAVAVGVYRVAKRLWAGSERGALSLRFSGFALAGIGAAFLAGVVLG